MMAGCPNCPGSESAHTCSSYYDYIQNPQTAWPQTHSRCFAHECAVCFNWVGCQAGGWKLLGGSLTSLALGQRRLNTWAPWAPLCLLVVPAWSLQHCSFWRTGLLTWRCSGLQRCAFQQTAIWELIPFSEAPESLSITCLLYLLEANGFKQQRIRLFLL